jgi:hypothetical protein
MKSGPGQPISAAVRRAQEWQRLGWIIISRVMGHYLHGCASVAMAHTPQQALAALHKTQTGLFTHSAHALALANLLWRKQNTELLISRAEHAQPLGFAVTRPGPGTVMASGQRQRHAGKPERTIVGRPGLSGRHRPGVGERAGRDDFAGGQRRELRLPREHLREMH